MAYCVGCGSKLKETDIFCSNCGLKVGSVPGAANRNPAYEENYSDESDDDLEDIILLNDEHGIPVKFRFLDLIDYRGKDYVILEPLEDDSDGEVIILEVQTDRYGDESYVSVDDIRLLNKVFEEFKRKNIDIYEFED